MKPYPALLSELLSAELSSLRQKKALTQEAMAERLRISSRAYSDLERGRYAASAPTLMFIIRLSAKGTDGVMKPRGAFAVENCLLYCPRRCSANYTDRGGEWRGCIAATPHVYMVRPPVKASTNGASK